MERLEVKTNMYDKTEYYFNVDIQVLINTITGEQSIGWARINSPISDEWRKEYEDGEADN